eukprot:355292-Chlamydomonas_euryale.AAC.6
MLLANRLHSKDLQDPISCDGEALLPLHHIFSEHYFQCSAATVPGGGTAHWQHVARCSLFGWQGWNGTGWLRVAQNNASFVMTPFMHPDPHWFF